MPPWLLVALLHCLPGLSLTFKPLFSSDGESITHREITKRAILRKTAEVCESRAAAEGWIFSLAYDESAHLSAYRVQTACSSGGSTSHLRSSIRFKRAISTMYLSNAAVDVDSALSEKHHFDSESFREGKELIIRGVSAVKASVNANNFLFGRLVLGRVLHTLQDFYSHSNWVELGHRMPYSSLIRPDEHLENLADPNTPTCRSCSGSGPDCPDNILPEVTQKHLLTSGYFDLFHSKKPKGKCSHGTSFDRTNKQDPRGGINKDNAGASHGHLHQTAATLAIQATMELLEDIREASGDASFLKLMGLSHTSALCFVIDTTVSMSDDIAEVKRTSFSIMDRRRGTAQEPSLYILVPFNDPDFGPRFMSTDADIFKEKINELEARGGFDIEEYCLSGLQLALSAVPPNTDVFVFTDAPAKDVHLRGAVTALIETTKAVVTFMLTDSQLYPAHRHGSSAWMGGADSQLHRHGRSAWMGGADSQLHRHRRSAWMGDADSQLYRDLAQASGGQVIQVTKKDLSEVTGIIEDTTTGNLVTVVQAVRNPGHPETFSFVMDRWMTNVTAYITGASSLIFTVSSPTAISQSSWQPEGPLGLFSLVGNLRRLCLNDATLQAGSWEIRIQSNHPYSIKVTGQSSLDFIYNFVEKNDGAHSGLSLKEGRPVTGGEANLLISLTGSETAKLTEVTLVEGSRSQELKGSLQLLEDGNTMVTFSSVPYGTYGIHLKGEEGASSTEFQRQAPTQIKTSNVFISANLSSTIVEPGSSVTIPFTVARIAHGTIDPTGTGKFTMRQTNNRGYQSSFPTTVVIAKGSRGKAEGIVTLMIPASAASGSDVTTTVEAEDPRTSDTNYAILRFTVVSKATDITRPRCQVISTSGICPSSPSLCGSSQWQMSASFTDGVNGTGINRLKVHQGNGSLNTSSSLGAGGENITLVTYSANCCSRTVKLVAVDHEGNVGKCQVTNSAGCALLSTVLQMIVMIAVFCR